MECLDIFRGVIVTCLLFCCVLGRGRCSSTSVATTQLPANSTAARRNVSVWAQTGTTTEHVITTQQPDVRCFTPNQTNSTAGISECYHIPVHQMNWTAARDNCSALGQGWELAQIETQKAHDFLKIIMKHQSLSDVWIGAHRLDLNWTWVDNSPLEVFRPWKVTIGLQFTCAYIDVASPYQWDKRPCAFDMGFVCELPANKSDCEQQGGLFSHDRCFKGFNQPDKEWEDSKTYCANLGGFLAKIDNSSLQTALGDYLKGRTPTRGFWIGLSQSTWVWTTGVPLTKTFWGTNEPSPFTKCAYMHRYSAVEYIWRCKDCSSLQHFACRSVIHDESGQRSTGQSTSPYTISPSTEYPENTTAAKATRNTQTTMHTISLGSTASVGARETTTAQAKSSPKTQGISKTLAIIIGVGSGFVMLVILCGSLIVLHRHCSKNKDKLLSKHEGDGQSSVRSAATSKITTPWGTMENYRLGRASEAASAGPTTLPPTGLPASRYSSMFSSPLTTDISGEEWTWSEMESE